jgi:hypothetical protein
MQDIDTTVLGKRDIKHILPTVLALATGACAPSPPAGEPAQSSAEAGKVQVTTDRSSYRAGDPITLTVHNGSADTVAFNPCTRALEREQAGTWTAVPEPQRICTMEAWILAPGERRAGPTELPADLAAGRYRAVLAFTVESARPSAERTEARSAPFAVER